MIKISRARGLQLFVWTALLCIASQVPYYLVWAGRSTFPYDAFTTFNPWLVGQLAELRSGEGVLALYQDEVPFDVWPSYFFTGLLRQILSVAQANTAIGHAQVQALHAVLLVPAVALLCRSFRVPWMYGVIGGFTFSLMGLHVSLAHHVLAHEALLYLVLSLYSVRELILIWPRASREQRVALFGVTGVLMVSLVRVHHEAILYLVPFAVWAVGHLVVLHGRREKDGPWVTHVAFVLGCLGVLVGIASVPMLLTAYELSLINKTSIDSYSQLGAYFSDARVFFMALVLPGFSGGNAASLPAPFSFGQEATLSYVFFGSLTLPFLVVVLHAWWQAGKRFSAFALLAAVVILLGYAIGAGSPIHLFLCTVFPFLVNIGHNYYGLHLAYLVAAFVTGAGIYVVVSRHRYGLLAACALFQAAVLGYLSFAAIEGAGWGVQGSFEAFVSVLEHDLRWHAFVVSVLVLLAALWGLRVRGRTVGRGLQSRIGASRSRLVVTAVFAVVIGADMLRPVLSAHFVPSVEWVSWAHSPLGGFQQSKEVWNYLVGVQEGQQRPLRIVPVFPKGGGWQGNALMISDVHLVGMPGDSGGNRFVDAWLSQTPGPGHIANFVDRLGIDAVWVARWGVEEWQAALESTPSLEKVFSSAYGGDVYMRRNPPVPRYQLDDGVLTAPWNFTGEQVAVEEGVVARTWRFRLPALSEGRPFQRILELPLMWHAGYGIETSDGDDVEWSRSENGTLLVSIPTREANDVVVRYPSELLSFLVALAAAVYLGLLATAASACFLLFRRRWRTTQQPS